MRTLADRYQGRRFNSPNDVAIDRQGGSMSPTPAMSATTPASSISRRSSGSTPTAPHPPRDDAAKPNGLAVSPDRHDAVRSNGPKRRALLAFDLDPATGNVANPRVLHDFGGGRGVDGMTVTTDGRIVAAAGSGASAGVYVFAPAGGRLRLHPTPEAPDQRRIRRRPW